MKQLALLVCLSVLLAGCAGRTSHKRIEKRKQERFAAYSTLPNEQKAAVDGGHVMVGMDTNAVYIAWGKPSRVVEGETASGRNLTWLYQDTYLQSYTYWTQVPLGYHRSYMPGPLLVHDYCPVLYLRGEVIFEDGLVKQWRALPVPGK